MRILVSPGHSASDLTGDLYLEKSGRISSIYGVFAVVKQADVAIFRFVPCQPVHISIYGCLVQCGWSASGQIGLCHGFVTIFRGSPPACVYFFLLWGVWEQNEFASSQMGLWNMFVTIFRWLYKYEMMSLYITIFRWLQRCITLYIQWVLSLIGFCPHSLPLHFDTCTCINTVGVTLVKLRWTFNTLMLECHFAFLCLHTRVYSP